MILQRKDARWPKWITVTDPTKEEKELKDVLELSFDALKNVKSLLREVSIKIRDDADRPIEYRLLQREDGGAGDRAKTKDPTPALPMSMSG